MATVILPALMIRLVSPNDMDAICDLEELCFKDPYPSYFLYQLAEANAESFVVAVVDDKVVGYGVVDEWKDHNHLVSIAVHSDKRRRGIGRGLLLALEEKLENKRTLRLEVRKSNLPAIEFYSKNGFRETGALEGYYADGEDAILMEKAVTLMRLANV